MNITKDGWIQWSIRDPGPPDRWSEFDNAKTPVDAIYHHSFEGWFNPVSESGYNVMDDHDRFPTAWHGTVTSRPVKFKGITWKPGTLFQHYPINARLQHANGGNVIGPGFELEGMSPTPITDEQIKTYRAIHRDIAEWRGMKFGRGASPANVKTGGLIEHREAPGAQTGCPGVRYDRLWAAIAAEEEGMTKEEKEQFEMMLIRQSNLEFLVTGKTGSEALAIIKDLSERGILPLLGRVENLERNGDTVARSNINGHVQNHGAQVGGGVAPHDHVESKVVMKK